MLSIAFERRNEPSGLSLNPDIVSVCPGIVYKISFLRKSQTSLKKQKFIFGNQSITITFLSLDILINYMRVFGILFWYLYFGILLWLMPHNFTHHKEELWALTFLNLQLLLTLTSLSIPPDKI